MAGLEAVLRISAKDDAGSALAKVKAEIGALDKQIATFDKLGAAVGKVASATDPFVKSVAASSTALREQQMALTALRDGMESTAGAADAAASGQARLAEVTERATAVMVAQGSEAVRVSEQIQAAQRRASRAGAGGGAAGGFGKAINEYLPFAGPGILHETGKAIEAGATVQDEIARLAAAGAKPDQIKQAREDFIAFSKSHSGVSEADYLAGYRTAMTVAPTESFEMAGSGAIYRTALRNSGLPFAETDVENVMRMMDELGLKTQAERDSFLDNVLKVQQRFGSQISTGTWLSAVRNAKQSIYDWSPEFRNKLFPTLLQSSGEQGGTEMMTALSNYIGGHMQTSEFKSLIDAGFVPSKDIQFIHQKPVLRKGAHLFESDVFKKNIAQWAWDFHKEFMSRPGATEDQFGDLIAKMPRNMGALVSFMVHNQTRMLRDAEGIPLAAGSAAASDAYLGQNPGAGLSALGTAIEQFAASVTGPAVAAASPVLADLAHGVQLVAAASEQWAKDHPKEAVAGGGAAIAASLGVGGWLTFKLFTGIKNLLGFGGAAGEGAAAAAGAGEGVAAATGGGWLAAIGGALASAIEVAAPVILMRAIGETANPTTPAGAKYRVDTAWPSQREDMEKAWRAEKEWRADPEAAHARALGALSGGAARQDVSISGQAQVDQTLHVDISLEAGLRAEIDRLASLNFSVPLGQADTGRMDGDAAPRRGPGIGHM